MPHCSLETLYEESAHTLAQILLDGETLRPVFGIGPQNALLMLVGEAPGADETEQGRPFVGKAGRELNAFLKSVGLERKKLFVTNAVKYRPYKQNPKTGRKANRTPSRKEILRGKPLLLEEVRIVAPKVIATLGNSPLFALTDGTKSIGEVHGQAQLMSDGRILFPLYHPASVIYNRSLKSVYEADLLSLKKLIEQMEQVRESGLFMNNVDTIFDESEKL